MSKFSKDELGEHSINLSDQKDLIAEYPELENNLSLNESERLVISAVYNNIKSARHFLDYAGKGESTGSVEYVLQFAEDLLQKLKNGKKEVCQNFLQNEEIKLKALRNESKGIIGDKARGSDGIYR